MSSKAVSPKKVKKCRRCGNSVTEYKVKSKTTVKTVMVDVYHEDGFYVVLIKNNSVTEHICVGGL